MDKISKTEFKTLFSNLCCSRCRNDFEPDSLSIIEKYADLMICNLSCKKCGKDFGNIVLNYNKKSKIHNSLSIIDGPAPVSIDDVIDAHNFIKNFM